MNKQSAGVLRSRERSRANLVEELDAFLKERIAYDPESVISRDEFEMEFHQFVWAKGFANFKSYAMDKVRQQKGIRLRSSLRVSGIDYDGEIFSKDDGWYVRGFLGLKWKYRESLTIFNGKNRGLSNFKREIK